jgi:predicted protein tyrosine phosphatase
VTTRIAVCSIDVLSDAITRWKPDAVISVFSPSPRLRVESFTGRRHLVLLFHDIEMRIVHASSKGRMVGPSRRHVERVIEFLHERPDRLLIHCVAGLSRSPALAIVAGCELHGDPVRACTSVRSALPDAWPNRGVLQCADEVLKLDGRLMTIAAATFSERRAATQRSAFVELRGDAS